MVCPLSFHKIRTTPSLILTRFPFTRICHHRTTIFHHHCITPTTYCQHFLPQPKISIRVFEIGGVGLLPLSPRARTIGVGAHARARIRQARKRTTRAHDRRERVHATHTTQVAYDMRKRDKVNRAPQHAKRHGTAGRVLAVSRPFLACLARSMTTARRACHATKGTAQGATKGNAKRQRHKGQRTPQTRRAR